MLPGEGHSGVARGEIIRQIERVSFREDPAGGIGLWVGKGLREAAKEGGSGGSQAGALKQRAALSR